LPRHLCLNEVQQQQNVQTNKLALYAVYDSLALLTC